MDSAGKSSRVISERFRRKRRKPLSKRALGRFWLIPAALVLALIAFHVWILWERICDGSIFRSDVGLHWLAAFGLLAVAVWVRRRGASLLRGRHAGVFWLLVLLLHFAGTAPLPETVAGGFHLARQATLQLVLPLGVAGAVTCLFWGLLAHTASAVCFIANPFGSLAGTQVLACHTIDSVPNLFSRPPPA